MKSPYDVACSMFDGAWRASDRVELVEEYGFTDEELDQIVPFLIEMEAMEHGH